MKLFPHGITISAGEWSAFQHIQEKPEDWLLGELTAKVSARRTAMVKDWMPILLADPGVAELPATHGEFASLVMARPEYRSREAAEQERGTPPFKHNSDKFNGRRQATELVGKTLFRQGIDIDQQDADCILAYVRDLDDWVLGAIAGRIYKGRTNMLKKYGPILIDDPAVDSVPADEDALIALIVARADYVPMWRE